MIALLDIRKEKKRILDIDRDKELEGFVIDDIYANENIIKMMAVKFNVAQEKEQINWIDINNQTKTFTKEEFGLLIKTCAEKIEQIYFKYRKLKDELGA